MGGAPARAQYSADNQTNTVTAFTGWTGDYFVGSNTSFDVLLISGNGRLTNANGYVGYQALSSNNLVVVAGSNAAWSNSGTLYVGGTGNRLIITNGGRVFDNEGRVGGHAGVGGNVVVVSGNGSFWTNGAGGLKIGASLNSENRLIITNGGRVAVGNTLVLAWNAGTSNNLVLVSDSNSVLRTGANNAINVGGYGWGNQMVISNGAIASSGYGRVGGGLGGTGGSNASVIITGAGSVWSNGATAAVGFDVANLGRVSVLNGGSLVVAGVFQVDSSSLLMVSNGGQLSLGVVTNQGTIRVINSKVTFNSPVVLGGAYLSDPSTNTFGSNLTVTASGALSGSNGDLFVFHQDFINQSTNQGQFNLAHAAVLFTNATTHLLSVSNSGSADLGQGYTSFDQVATNFAIGQLSIASGNRVTLAGNQDSLTNALYVGWLDIQGISTNSFDAVTNGLFAALDLPNVNLYYDTYNPQNEWLNAWIPSTGYDLWGGGLLLPIPEPTSLLAVVGGAVLLTWLRRRKG